MSVAFTREDSAETASEVELPDRPISRHPNLVTNKGLEQLTAALSDARSLYDAAQKIDDVNDRRRAVAPVVRDIRYYTARVSTAQVVPAPTSCETVCFGVNVTFLRDDGRLQTFRIVGEDEGDPKTGMISYVSPVAWALTGKGVGDVVTVSDQELEIVSIA